MSAISAPIGFNFDNNDSLFFESLKPIIAEAPAEAPAAIKQCTPFLIDVMVFIPKAGAKIYFTILRGCSESSEPYWKLVFKYEKSFKVDENGAIDPSGTKSKFFTLVQVTISAGNQAEIDAAIKMSQEGPSAKTAEIVTINVAKELEKVAEKAEKGESVTKEEAENVTTAIRKVYITQ